MTTPLAYLVKLFAALGVAKFLAAGAIFTVLERVAPHRGRQPVFREGWVTDLLNYLVNGTLFVGILLGWRLMMPDGLPWLVTLPSPFNFRDQPAVVHAVTVVLLGSFIYYWGHRALHRFAFLWRFHAVHHSIEQIDWLASYRGHVLETCYHTTLVAIPTVVLGLSAPTTLAFIAYRVFEAHLEHSNFRIPLGPLKWVFPSPWFHHWHHSFDVVSQNRNFSPYPIWDVIFGTAYMPADHLPERLGVDVAVPPDYLGQLAFPFGLSAAALRLRKWITAA